MDIDFSADAVSRLKWRLFRARLAFENPRSRAFDRRHRVETAREEHLKEIGVASLGSTPAASIRRESSVSRTADSADWAAAHRPLGCPEDVCAPSRWPRRAWSRSAFLQRLRTAERV